MVHTSQRLHRHRQKEMLVADDYPSFCFQISQLSPAHSIVDLLVHTSSVIYLLADLLGHTSLRCHTSLRSHPHRQYGTVVFDDDYCFCRQNSWQSPTLSFLRLVPGLIKNIHSIMDLLVHTSPVIYLMADLLGHTSLRSHPHRQYEIVVFDGDSCFCRQNSWQSPTLSFLRLVPGLRWVYSDLHPASKTMFHGGFIGPHITKVTPTQAERNASC